VLERAVKKSFGRAATPGEMHNGGGFRAELNPNLQKNQCYYMTGFESI
jgi:hypothetical protein